MESYFVAYLGSVPTIRTLDFLIENRRTSWTLKEIAEQGGIAYPSLKLVMPRLLLRKLIFLERDLGKVKLYRLNEKNPVVKQLITLEREIIKQETGKYEKTVAIART